MNNDTSLKHALLGAAGGLAGLAALRLYWTVASALPGEDPRARTTKRTKKEMGERDVAAQQRQRRAEMAAAEEAPDDWDEERVPLFPTPAPYRVPWIYGPVLGAAYGVLFGPAPGRDLNGGLVFGAAAWLLGDEVLRPLIGRRKARAKAPLKQHAHRLGAHLACGGATAAATQALYRLALKTE